MDFITQQLEKNCLQFKDYKHEEGAKLWDGCPSDLRWTSQDNVGYVHIEQFIRMKYNNSVNTDSLLRIEICTVGNSLGV